MSVRWAIGRALPALAFAAVMLVVRPAAAETAAACGNGILEGGEQCDDGGENGGFNSCCASSCTFNGKSPDVIVGNLMTPYNWGPGLPGEPINAYSIGTTSCNVGTCWLNWFDSIPEHPVIAQNAFRLKNGRFEQIGQSWVKHGFEALQEPACGTCPHPAPQDGNHLGVNCSDPYVGMLNGSQTRLGPKSEVNAYTGVYNYPWNNNGSGTGALFKRLQIHAADLDPTLNPGALYFAEAQYVTHDDASAGRGANNNSWRRLTLTVGAGPSYSLSFSAANATVRESAAIQAWTVNDTGVFESSAQAPSDGLFLVSAKATALGGGTYHYEYAIQNLTSDRSGQSFSVPVNPGTIVTNIGFHDVDYHSGEPYVGTDWPGVFTGTTVTWATQTYAANVNANALRWGTLYNFRFDANVPPANGSATITLFKPGSPASVPVSTLVPMVCAPLESACGDGIDEDCDGDPDCADSDCCTSGFCVGFDSDGDTFSATCDCDDANGSVYPGAPQLCDGVNNDCLAAGWPAVPAIEADLDGDGVRVCAGDCSDSVASSWATPGEVRSLTLGRAGGSNTTLSWLPPLVPGSSAPRYDTIRSSSASNFVTGATCVETNGTDTASSDPDAGAPGAMTYYLVRCENDCPMGAGPLGEKSDHTNRTARTCP